MTENPAAWLVSRDGEPCYVSLKLVDASMERNRLELVSTGTPAIELIPLYRLPALTDAEREAVAYFAVIEGGKYLPAANTAAATLRKLLERFK